MTATIIEHEVEQGHTTSEDKDRCAHIVMDGKRPERDDPQAWLMEARVEGFPVVALCGYTWVPRTSAAGLPVCQECFDIYEGEDRSDDSGEGLPDVQ